MNKRITAFIITLSMILPTVAFADDALTELAANQYAESSSELSANTTADKANDGINDNEDYTAWRSADTDVRPYWQTDLAIAYKISKIEIEARKGGTAEERSNFRVIASNDSDFETYEVLGECTDDFGADKIWSVDIKAKDRYQFVRVEKTADGALSIGEIRIYAKTSTIFYGNDKPATNSLQPATDMSTRYQIPTDVVGTDIEDEVYFLSSLNIMRGYPDGTFAPDSFITRAEFAAVASKMLNYNTHMSSNTFGDVPTTHWAYNSVEICYEAGLIDGFEEGIFAPDEEVTFEQAVKIIVSALGYGNIALSEGGYPGGYIEIARTLGILDGISNDNGQISRGNIAKMCYNALFAKLKNPSDNYDKEESILTKYFKLSKMKGIVTEVTGMSLTDSGLSTLDETYIEVNNMRLRTDCPYYRDWFGYNVEVYYSKGDGYDYDAVVVIPSSNSNTVEIEIDDDTRFDDSNVLHYYVGTKEKRLSFRGDLDVVWNGKAKLVYSNSTLIPDHGYIKAIDNDGDNKYDIMIIRQIRTVAVNFVNDKDNIIYAKDDPTPVLWGDNDAVTIRDIEGNPVELKNIKEWNILSIEMSDNTDGEKAIDICVSDVFARGQITAIGRETITIRDKEYRLSNSAGLSSLRLGDKGIFYLDCYGDIAAFDGESTTSGKYGIITKVYEKYSGGDIYVRLFNASGNIKDYKVSNRLTIDNVSKTSLSDIETALANTNWGKVAIVDGDGNVTGWDDPYNWNNISQLVKFSANSKGEIYMIDTIAPGGPNPSEEDNLSRDFDNTSRTYIGESATFGMNLMLADNVFFVRCPDDWSAEGFEIVSRSSLEGGIGHTFEAYDANALNVASAAVIMPGIGLTPSYGNSFIVVDEVMDGINTNEDSVQIIKCWHNGKLVEYAESKPGVASPLNLSKGDIIALTLTADGEIKSVVKRFYNETLPSTPSGSISLSKPIGPNNQNPSWNSCFYYGTVKAREGSIVKIKLNAPDNYVYDQFQEDYKEILVNLSNVKDMYLYDSSDDTVRVATSSDFLDEETTGQGVRVVLKMGNYNVRQAVILK